MKDEKEIEKEIAACHAADLQNGLTEQQASESDAFERRVLGLPEPHDDRYGDAGYSGCYDD